MKSLLNNALKFYAPSLSSTLGLAYFFALLGPYFYFFDLFVHFKLQYAVGGVILFPALIYLKKYKWAAIVIFIALISFFETRISLDKPWRFRAPNGPETYTVVSYNHNYGRSYFDLIESWIRDNSQDNDVVILIEATNKTLSMAAKLADTYPFQIHQPMNNGGFGMIVLSKYEFLDAELIPFTGGVFDNIAIRFQYKKSNAKHPLTVYAAHPPPPAGPGTAEQRNNELHKLAELIAEDESKNILLIGDLNITPYSKTFSKVLSKSGLNFQSYGFFQNASWPSFLFIPLFQIPIDHSLYSGNLVQERKYIGPAIMSDHHVLIAGYSEKEE